MTPERLDTIERLAKTPSTVTPPFGLGRTLFDSADVLDLIAHIRDLEAQDARLKMFETAWNDEDGEHGPYVGWDDYAWLLAENQKLEAQLATAREYVKRAGHTNDAGGDPCNYFMRFHEKSRYICTCGYEEALAAATPPSPEVGA